MQDYVILHGATDPNKRPTGIDEKIYTVKYNTEQRVWTYYRKDLKEVPFGDKFDVEHKATVESAPRSLKSDVLGGLATKKYSTMEEAKAKAKELVKTYLPHYIGNDVLQEKTKKGDTNEDTYINRWVDTWEDYIAQHVKPGGESGG